MQIATSDHGVFAMRNEDGRPRRLRRAHTTRGWQKPPMAMSGTLRLQLASFSLNDHGVGKDCVFGNPGASRLRDGSDQISASPPEVSHEARSFQ